MSFGKPTVKLRKLLRSKLTLATALILFMLVVSLRSGLITMTAWQKSDTIQNKDQDEHRMDEPSSSFSKTILNPHKRIISRPSLKMESLTEKKSIFSEKSRFQHHNKKVSPSSFKDFVDETNPSHSLTNDRNYKSSDLKQLVQSLNENQLIMNLDKFPNRDKNGVIIVIQVHKRLEYFIELLSSLEKAKGIDQSLLIISSDWYSDSIVEAVKKVKFCQVMHIFFPFAEQLHSDAYPGTDPNDCPRDIKQEEAKKKQCINADYPDKYGHYREAKYTMTKHHWWWKVNVIFDKLPATKNSNGPVVFLEEDHYVAPDFYHSIIKLHRLKQSDSRCENNCEVLNLGMYVKAENYVSIANKQVSSTRWRSYDHNMGMIWYRSTWEAIKQCAEVFCKYDDYNWDWTLMHISLNCLKKPLNVLSMDLPRVFHIGECGMHHKGNCNPKQAVDIFDNLIQQNSDAFFPDELVIANVEEGDAHTGMENGGWGDKRDHDLCQSFVKKSNLANF